jgi:hypothetical protein
MWPFKRKQAKLIEVGNPEPGLDKWSKAYRLERIVEIAEYTGKSIEEATVLADMWFIRTLQVRIGDDPMKIQYCPCPVWDDEWAFRACFDTKEEALAHVESKRGELLVPDIGPS